MTDSFNDQSSELPEQIAAEANRERTIRRGTISAIHRWWARRPIVLARVATYLAITRDKNPDPLFLAALGAVEPNPSALTEACIRVRDSAWQWSLQEANHGSTSESLENILAAPDAPRVLDPFGGGGAIPLEASRLGCAAYTGDISPVAYFVLRATLEFPAAFLQPTPAVTGTGVNGTWAGLPDELRYWTRMVEQQAIERLKDLFPAMQEGSGDVPDRYIWFTSVRCAGPGCSAVYPLQDALVLTERPIDQCLTFSRSNGQATPAIVGKANSKHRRNTLICPECSLESRLSDLTPASFAPAILGAVRRGPGEDHEIVIPTAEQARRLSPWSPQHESRLQSLLNMPFARQLELRLPQDTYRALHNCGHTTFKDLFSRRQLLVGLEYTNATIEVLESMEKAGLPKDRIQALRVYLAFFISYLVDRNSKLCGWNYHRRDSGTSFDRVSPAFSRVYVERLPFGLAYDWLTRLIPALQTAASVRPAAKLYVGDASHLPFSENHFDAVVTDPPYYDCIPYAELAGFYWVWESGILTCNDSGFDFGVSTENNFIESKESGGNDIYEQKMLGAFREIYRVLKSARKLCLIFTGHATRSFEAYVDLCQQAGFELIDVRSLPEAVGFSTQHLQKTYLIYFRKPSDTPVRQPLRAAENADLLEAAEAGRPVLYAALADLIAKELPSEDVPQLLPIGGKGSVVEQLMEVLAEADPRDLMERCFGIGGLRRIANSLKTTEGDAPIQSPIEFILSSFGFALPSLSDRINGVAQVRETLRVSGATIARANDRSKLLGAFQKGCSELERLLRGAIWGWAQLLFGSDRDKHLLEILKEKNPDKHYDLDRLSFGHVLSLFRGLPDHIAGSAQVSLIERKFGRRHIYHKRQEEKIL